MYQFVYDDEDRLVQGLYPGVTDTFVYNGLGLRVGKTDSTGTYSYLCDGVSPASDVLSDGYVSFTPGLSETNGLGSRFYLPDAQGNSRGLLDNNQGNPDGYNWDGFGNSVSRFGGNPTAFAWNVSSGYQSDNDSGLKLLGHRYYDSRTGRFLSQDPAGDGDNWYSYADNDPMDEVDPSGLKMKSIGDGYWEDENTGQVAFGLDGANLSGDSISADGRTDTGTTTIHGGGGDVTGPPDANNFGFGGVVDNWVTFGAITHAGNVAGAYDSGRASRRAALGAGALAVGAILAAGASEGRDAAEVDTARFIEAWGKGTFETVEKSWAYHFEKHGEEVGAESLLQYLRKAEGFNQNLRGATKSVLDNAIRHSKNGKYIIKDLEGKILSFGSIR